MLQGTRTQKGKNCFKLQQSPGIRNIFRNFEPSKLKNKLAQFRSKLSHCLFSCIAPVTSLHSTIKPCQTFEPNSSKVRTNSKNMSNGVPIKDRVHRAWHLWQTPKNCRAYDRCFLKTKTVSHKLLQHLVNFTGLFCTPNLSSSWGTNATDSIINNYKLGEFCPSKDHRKESSPFLGLAPQADCKQPSTPTNCFMVGAAAFHGETNQDKQHAITSRRGHEGGPPKTCFL